MAGAGGLGKGSSGCIGDQLRVEKVPVRTSLLPSLVLCLSASSRHLYLLQPFQTSLIES